jgi:hypothetical protein
MRIVSFGAGAARVIQGAARATTAEVSRNCA